MVWYKNRIIIANGQNPISQRVQCMLNNSILLRNVSPEDSDDYYCEILPQRVRQHTALRVGARLSILCDDRDITDRSQTFRQGDHHKLECRTYLPDNATIKWSFNVCFSNRILALSLSSYRWHPPPIFPHDLYPAGSERTALLRGQPEWRDYPRQC